MRKYSILLLTGLVLLSTSCKKFLDINANPNTPTSSSPDLILPQALVTTAGLSVTFNGYGASLSGQLANAGGFSGFGAGFMSYNFSTGDYSGLWSGTYDNANDYQYILNNTTATGDLKYYNAIARTMKAFSFLRLVDAYGNVPYSQALLSSANVTPTYDKGEDVYKACIAELNTALTTFKSAATGTTVRVDKGTAGKVDVALFLGGATGALSGSAGTDMAGWVKFANTIKLRALLRIQKVTSLASTYTTEMAAIENNFITGDVCVNPGYAQQSGKQNPTWNSWAYGYTGTLAVTSQEPATFVIGFYNGAKLFDDGRGKIVYRNYTTNNQLGNQVNAPVVASPTGIFYSGAATGTAAAYIGVTKGPTQAQPLMLAAESYFLQAEANTLGFLGGAGSTAGNFNKGILASFTYLDLDQNGANYTGRNPTTEVAAYVANNPYVAGAAANSAYLVNPANWATINTNDYNQSVASRTLEAIITQKYIATVNITADEGWNEYRRTKFPRTVPLAAPALDMASSASLSTRADRLPGRILYPGSEFSYNPTNVPQGINPFTSLIFWDIAATGGSR